MTRSIDELNNLKRRSVDPKIYFGEMDLTEEEYKKRIEFTERANEIFDVILILLLSNPDGYLEYQYMLESELISLIGEYAVQDDYLIDYAMSMSESFVDTAMKHKGEEWYFSSDRALFNAENSANDVFNYDEYQSALAAGKKYKMWITENDTKVRKTHNRLERKILPIKEFYEVGETKMRFPKDMKYAINAPQETVHCRCKIKYLDNKERI